MEWIESFYERLDGWSEHDRERLLGILRESMSSLDTALLRENDYPGDQYTKLDIEVSVIDVLFYLLKISRERGARLDLIIKSLNRKLDHLTFAEKSSVPPRRVIDIKGREKLIEK